jgi:RNA polymerase sigma-70 factor (ECF subfamily)
MMATDRVPENRLIGECLQGDTSAFGELVRRYQDRLYHTAYRLVGNAEDAQDVVQDAFLHAFQALDSFRGDSQIFTWLSRIAINIAINLRRKHRVAVSMEAAHEGGPALDPVDRSEYGRPGHALEQAEQERAVQRALTRLPAEHRTVLILKDMEGQKYETMAEVLQVPVGTIRSRLHRARLELRKLLADEDSNRESSPWPRNAPASCGLGTGQAMVIPAAFRESCEATTATQRAHCH